MAYKKILGPKELLLTDFTAAELESIETIAVKLYDSLAYVSPNYNDLKPVLERPESWNVTKAWLFTMSVVTKDLSSNAFVKLDGCNRLLSQKRMKYDTNTEWDIFQPTLSLQNLAWKGWTREIFDIIQPKYQESLDIAEFNKQLKIKEDLELIYSRITNSVYDMKLQLELDQADGNSHSNAKQIIQLATTGLSIAFPAAAPLIQVIGGVTALLSTMSDPDPATVIRDKYLFYDSKTKSIKDLQIQLTDFITRIHTDGYDYDFTKNIIKSFSPIGTPQTLATFTAKANQDGTITVQGITNGDIVSIDGVAQIAATSNTFTTTAQKDGEHKVTVYGTGLFSYVETVNVTTKASLFSSPLTFIQNNAVTVAIVVFILIVLYVAWKRGFFNR